MDELLWAFGSMLIVLVVIYLLPLGLTKKGKAILVSSSFILALGGLAATTSFSFLLSLIILVVLILFVTYLLDQRLGRWLYSKEESFVERENEDMFLETQLQTAASLEKIHQQKNDALEPLSLLEEKKEKNASVEATEASETDIPFETGDEDISFLLKRSISLDNETSKKQKEQKHDEVDYLSEIEELLNDNLDHLQTIDRTNLSHNRAQIADDGHEIPVISFEDKPLKKKSESSNGQAKKIEDFDEIPVLPFHEKEGDE
jgi:hypothetical protein